TADRGHAPRTARLEPGDVLVDVAHLEGEELLGHRIALVVVLHKERHEGAVIGGAAVAEGPVHHRIEAAAELFDHRFGERGAGHKPVGRFHRAAHEFATEDRAGHLVADMEAPAAALV